MSLGQAHADLVYQSTWQSTRKVPLPTAAEHVQRAANMVADAGLSPRTEGCVSLLAQAIIAVLRSSPGDQAGLVRSIADMMES